MKPVTRHEFDAAAKAGPGPGSPTAADRAPVRSSRAVRTSPGRARWRVTSGTPGDHPAIHPLLMQVFHRPSLTEFQASLDRPDYDPGQRLVARGVDRRGLVGQVQFRPRVLYFGAAEVPVTEICDLAVLPECALSGLDDELVAEAERGARVAGAMLLTARTPDPAVFLRRGWVTTPGDAQSTGNPQAILTALAHEPHLLGGAHRWHTASPRVRLWRHVEQDALASLYTQQYRHTYGAVLRDEAYWRWLLVRRGYDRIYVLGDQESTFSPPGRLSRILAYAAVKRGDLVELADATEDHSGAALLLVRVCRDAVEQGRGVVRCSAPPGSCVHRWLRRAAGESAGCRRRDDGMTCVARLLQPHRFTKSIARELRRRIRPAAARSGRLSVATGGESTVFQFGPRSVRISRGQPGRHHVALSDPAATRLLLGLATVSELEEEGAAQATTGLARNRAGALFPRIPFHRPLLDDLPA
jgi:hypothetical protein